MPTPFRPAKRLPLRVTVFAVLAAFGLLGSAGVINTLIWLVSLAFLLGSYREAQIGDGQFERRLVLLFIPQPWKRWSLEKFYEIESKYADPSEIEMMLPGFMLFTWQLLWGALFDWLIPWMGGSYKLRLRLAKGGSVLVWQGNSDANFQANLALLQNCTSLPLRRG